MDSTKTGWDVIVDYAPPNDNTGVIEVTPTVSSVPSGTVNEEDDDEGAVTTTTLPVVQETNYWPWVVGGLLLYAIAKENKWI